MVRGDSSFGFLRTPERKTLDGKNRSTGSYLDALQTADSRLSCNFKDKMCASFSH